MIKRFAPAFCALALAMSAADAHAQRRTTDLILSAGGTMGFSTDEDATESRIGLNVSGGLSLRVADMIGLRAEAGYIQKGAGSELSGGGATGDAAIEIDYVELRGLLEIGGDFHILAGATLGREFQCDVAINASFEGVDVSSEQTCEDLSFDTSNDLGLTAGVGYNLGPLGATLLVTEGLNEIFDAADAPGGRNRTISLIGSLRIPIAG